MDRVGIIIGLILVIIVITTVGGIVFNTVSPVFSNATEKGNNSIDNLECVFSNTAAGKDCIDDKSNEFAGLNVEESAFQL